MVLEWRSLRIVDVMMLSRYFAAPVDQIPITNPTISV